LIDIRDPVQSYSAADFRTDALREMQAIIAQGGIPLLVGGTSLYFHVLMHGISALPKADPQVRARLEAAAEKDGWSALHRHLARIDSEAAARIHPHDPQRIQRALEVYEISGKTLTELFACSTRQPLPYRLIKLVLAPNSRTLLHDRLCDRFSAMLKQGLIEEVRRLYEREDLYPLLPAMRVVGYRQIWQYFDRKWDYDTMVKKAIIATRQLAKRQLTWLRSEIDAQWFNCEDPRLLEVISGYLNPGLNSWSD
jgi:tRNA dimethylallyltransferase